MSWDFFTTQTSSARKDYPCDACEWLLNSTAYVDFSFSDLRLIAKAKRDNWKIKKGTQYLKTKGKWEGEWAFFRARPEIDEICIKYELYEY